MVRDSSNFMTRMAMGRDSAPLVRPRNDFMSPSGRAIVRGQSYAWTGDTAVPQLRLETLPSPKMMLPNLKFTNNMIRHISPKDVALHGTEAGRSKSSFGISDYKPRLVNFKV